jgi:hypothetical protein
MIGAIVRNNIVDNLIVLNEAQIDELSAALNCEIVDARPYGLNVGDLRTDAGWTRNAGGEQMILPLLEPEAYDSYSVAAARVVELEEAQEGIAEAAIDEALAILTGEVEA